MHTVVVPAWEGWDEKRECFVKSEAKSFVIEHSLVSLEKWEAKYKKPFLKKAQKTPEELLDYVKFMTITQNVDDEVYLHLTADNIKEIKDYIDDPMTATKFKDDPNAKKSKEIITSELIYYWMIASNIPFECKKWHLNRLLTLIRVCGIKNKPPKKMGKKNVMRQNSALNAARRQRMNTRG